MLYQLSYTPLNVSILHRCHPSRVNCEPLERYLRTVLMVAKLGYPFGITCCTGSSNVRLVW